ncbi:ATP-binding cassette domain-containing protein [Cellulomonas alba]|uniref:ATP-binding cassette domain-containing protein n=1 Tax=Cellulomonas alba TaxID=3053467 RepID=A0ABT7SC09_9CELL|nr:ATP-binding cassette domain-containing protein [Cellulomonas alba]MDM7853720.1 ATP-binding cassette domain-containing protein [Cellulomonas alba]
MTLTERPAHSDVDHTPQPAAPTDEPLERPAPVVVARRLALHGERGTVYGPVDLDVPAGTLTVLHGPQGAGRTSLLLTLAGRMVPDRGSSLTVLGRPLPHARREVQRRVAVAGFSGIDDLDDSVTVAAHVRERIGWLSPWYRRVPRADQATVDGVLAPVFGTRAVPAASTVVWHLDEVDALLLRIALAMAQRPRLLVVDDVDRVQDPARRAVVWRHLSHLAETGTTVVAATSSFDTARDATPVVRVVAVAPAS